MSVTCEGSHTSEILVSVLRIRKVLVRTWQSTRECLAIPCQSRIHSRTKTNYSHVIPEIRL